MAYNLGASMDIMVNSEHSLGGFCSFGHLKNKGRFESRSRATFSSFGIFMGHESSFLVLPAGGTMSRRLVGSCGKRSNGVFAFSNSKNQTLRSYGKYERVMGGRLHATNSRSSMEPLVGAQKELRSNWELNELINNGQLDEGFEWVKRIVGRGDTPICLTCRNLIRELCSVGEVKKATRVLEIIEDWEGVLPDAQTYQVLIEATYKNTGVRDALKLFQGMLSNGCDPDWHLFNFLVNVFCKEGRANDAIQLLDTMTTYDYEPTEVTYSVILRSLTETGRLKEAKELLLEMQDRGCTPSVVIFNILIDFFCQKGLLGRAINLLEKMPSFGCTPDNTSYNLVLHCFYRQNKMDRGFEYMDVMVSKGFQPDVVTYNIIISALSRDGTVDIAIDMLHQMRAKGCTPVAFSYNRIIKCLIKTGKTVNALELLEDMLQHGVEPNKFTYDFLLEALKRQGTVHDAVDLFQKLEGLGVRLSAVMYNAIISRLCKARRTDRAIDFFTDMVSSKGCQPTEATYRLLIEGLAYEGLREEAKELLHELCSRGVVTESSAQQICFGTSG